MSQLFDLTPLGAASACAMAASLCRIDLTRAANYLTRAMEVAENIGRLEPEAELPVYFLGNKNLTHAFLDGCFTTVELETVGLGNDGWAKQIRELHASFDGAAAWSHWCMEQGTVAYLATNTEGAYRRIYRKAVLDHLTETSSGKPIEHLREKLLIASYQL